MFQQMQTLGRGETIQIEMDGVVLEGDLEVPEGARGLVLFAPGPASSRHSPRQRFVAARLRDHRLGTLLLDLLTEEEEQSEPWPGSQNFDISQLARRLTGIVDWMQQQPVAEELPLGLFGAQTGAAIGAMTAAARPESVAALVSRGGRIDLAESALVAVRAPTLLIVGGQDEQGLNRNERALWWLGSDIKDLSIVPGAGPLFEEAGMLEVAARRAANWFARYLVKDAR